MNVALADVDAGDLAWWRGDRGAAVAAWHRALDEADQTPEGHAAEAMARIRLLRREGNLAPFWHERALDRALAACPEAVEACRLAEADFRLFMPAFAGGDPSTVDDVLAGDTSPAALARRVAAGAEPRLLDGVELDGFGRGLVESGRRLPPDPGTWTLGLGVAAAPGAGFGLGLRFVDPDLAHHAHRLELAAAGSTRAEGYGSVVFTSAGGVRLSGFAGRLVGDVWHDGAATTYTTTSLRASAGVGVGGLQVGVAGRVDDAAVNVGPYASVTLGGVTGWAEAGSGAYDHLAVGLDARAQPRLGGGRLALRGAATLVATPSPWYRLPSAGGSTVLRGLSAGWVRSPSLLVAQAEYRHPMVGPLEGCVFWDGAMSAESGHWTTGAGVHLVLPPGRDNVTRLELGVGPEGWGLVVGWGDAF